MVTRLTNNVNRSGIFATNKAKGKRKMEEPTKIQSGEKTSKNQRVMRNFRAQAQTLECGHMYVSFEQPVCIRVV